MVFPNKQMKIPAFHCFFHHFPPLDEEYHFIAGIKITFYIYIKEQFNEEEKEFNPTNHFSMHNHLHARFSFLREPGPDCHYLLGSGQAGD